MFSYCKFLVKLVKTNKYLWKVQKIIAESNRDKMKTIAYKLNTIAQVLPLEVICQAFH